MTATQPGGEFATGSLVRARGREWVVLPDSQPDLLVLRPLGGSDDEIAGIYLPLETVEPARFALPDPEQVGDYRSARMLRDAVRLGFRSSAGPFRSFGQIAVEPRPYQLVPLLMALRLEPVRLLIADDVGIGKTVEAALIARELLDRGEVERLAVLCPPHLAQQWQAELREKFHIEAETVLPSTVTRLERGLGMGQSLFEVHPFVIVSTDFIKSERRRNEFLRTCPELVIVDEAHTCAVAAGESGRRSRHQRHELLRGVAAARNRHLILVTATPHSGNESAFRSLLELLDPEFANLPDDLTGPQNERHRRRLARKFVQRRRGDIRHFMQADTPFPDRQERDETWHLSPNYRRLFERALAYARETVQEPDPGGGVVPRHRQRVRWWSALALLRSLGSSPAAAASTLRARAATADTDTVEEADEVGRHAVLDAGEDESLEGIDVSPGADIGEMAGDESEAQHNRRRLLEMARQAEELTGDNDPKLLHAVGIVQELLADGFNPIVFCRFIPTAEYVAAELRARLAPRRGRGRSGTAAEVMAVTGLLPPDEREARVAELGQAERRVLVCTDCLSEGINLQEHFDAVIHYDLSWNPTRHEQREGRVDRFGQEKPIVRAVTYYGADNQIDGIVLDVLLRKHRTIRNSLGVSVPVPDANNQVVEAIFEGLILRERGGVAAAQYLPGLEEYLRPQVTQLHLDWDDATERERRSRTMFAHEGIDPSEVGRELASVQSAVGSGVDVRDFTLRVLEAHGGVSRPALDESVALDLSELPGAMRDLLGPLGRRDAFGAAFKLPAGDETVYLSRTHPFVEGLASWVLDTALDPLAGGVARRAGVIRTSGVTTRTTLLLLRYRFHIHTRQAGGAPLLAEESGVLAFEGAPASARWLDSAAAERLLSLQPTDNVLPQQATVFLQQVIDGYEQLIPHLQAAANERAAALLDAHRRVRSASAAARVEPHLPSDVLGIYVYIP